MQHTITARSRALLAVVGVFVLAVGCADGPGDEVLAEIGGTDAATSSDAVDTTADTDTTPTDPTGAGLREELAAAGLSDATIACVLDAAEASGLDLRELDPSASASPAAAAALAPCLDDLMNEMFGQLGDEMGDAFTDGFEDFFDENGPTFDFGEPTSQAELDRLADACRGGDNAACDDLWISSPIDSPEERLAESCGGRASEPHYATCELFLD